MLTAEPLRLQRRHREDEDWYCFPRGMQYYEKPWVGAPRKLRHGWAYRHAPGSCRKGII